MADPDEPVMDFGAKKKKKKKPMVLDDDGEEAKPEEPAEEDDGMGGAVDFGKKKKKKDKPKIVDDEADAEVEELTEEFEAFGKKKKKKKPKEEVKVEEDDDDEDIPNDDDEDHGDEDDDGLIAAAKPWLNSERDYKYEEMLERMYEYLHSNNPELAGDRKRFVIKPPQVVREGTKKVVFINFAEICKMMSRNPEHVFAFMLAELGTTGSIDGNQRMVIKGRFQAKGIENIIRRYVGEYVTCNSCRSPNTLLEKDNRLFFLQCQNCGARRSVTAIKSGFVAQVGKRKKLLAKQG